MAKSATRIRNVTFTTKRIIAKNRRIRARALRDTAREMTQMFRKVLGRPYPPASRPGQPPRKRTPGTGLCDTTEAVYRDGDIIVRTKQYGIYLDGGFRHYQSGKIVRRKWLRKNLHDKRRDWERKIRTRIRQLSK